MESVFFPSQVRDYFQKNHDEKENEQLNLTNIFASTAVKEEFISWAKAYQSIVVYTPRLYRAFNLATDSDGWKGIAKSIYDRYLTWTDDGSASLIDHILIGKRSTVDSFPSNYILIALELYESGIVDFSHLVTLLSMKDEEGNCPLYDAYRFEEALPLLGKLDAASIVTLLSLKNQEGNCLLHFSNLFEKALPLLEKLDAGNLVTLLSLKDSEGKSPIHYTSLFEKAIPFLEKLDAQNLVTLLSRKDVQGKSPLHYLSLFEKALPLLEKLDAENLVILLSLKNNQGKGPLHSSSLFKKAIPLLEKLEQPSLVTLFSLKRGEEKSPLLSSSVFKKALPLLEKLDVPSLETLFSLKDGEGKTGLHFPRLIKKALPLLKMLDGPSLVTLLSMKNRFGDTPLHKTKICQEVLPLLDKLDIPTCVSLFSIKNQYDNCPLHKTEIFKMAIPILVNMPYDSLRQLISIRYNRKKNFGQDLIINQNTSHQLLTYKNLMNSLIREKDSMTPEKKLEKVALLQKIAKEMLLIDGDDEFISMVQKQLDVLLAVKPGRKLIKALGKKQRKITIQQSSNDSYANFIVEHSGKPSKYTTINESFEFCQYIKPSSLTLAHELIHALHYLSDTMASFRRHMTSQGILKNITNAEEQYTITGFDWEVMSRNHPLKKVDVLCENAFLMALDFPLRIDHEKPPESRMEWNPNFDGSVDFQSAFFSWLEGEMQLIHNIPKGKEADREYVLKFLKDNPSAIYSCPKEFKEDDDFVLELMKSDPEIVACFPELLKNKDFVFKMVEAGIFIALFSMEKTFVEDEDFIKKIFVEMKQRL